jgi:hypothetical protein
MSHKKATRLLLSALKKEKGGCTECAPIGFLLVILPQWTEGHAGVGWEKEKEVRIQGVDIGKQLTGFRQDHRPGFDMHKGRQPGFGVNSARY